MPSSPPEESSNSNCIDEPTRTVKRSRWWVHLVLIGGYVVPAIPLGWRQVHRPLLSSSAKGALIIGCIQVALFAPVFGVGWLFSRASREQLFLRWKPGWWVVPLGIGYSLAIRFVIGIVLLAMIFFLLVTGVLTLESVPQFLTSGRPDVKKLVDISAMRNNSHYFWVMVTLNSFVLAGLREEMWRAGTLAAMRTLWPNVFGDRQGQIVAVALIAILFGFAHSLFGLLAIGVTAIMGFCLGLIIVVHKSIWPAVIARTDSLMQPPSRSCHGAGITPASQNYLPELGRGLRCGLKLQRN